MDRYDKMRSLLGKQGEHFARGELRTNAPGGPPEQCIGSPSAWIRCSKAVLRTAVQWPLAAPPPPGFFPGTLPPWGFPPHPRKGSQKKKKGPRLFELDVGLPGTARQWFSAVIGRISWRAKPRRGQWQTECSVNPGRQPVLATLQINPPLRAAFRRTGASGVPTLGRCLRHARLSLLDQSPRQCLLLLALFRLRGPRDKEGTGVHARSRATFSSIRCRPAVLRSKRNQPASIMST